MKPLHVSLGDCQHDWQSPRIEFDTVLHNRGTDFRFWRNEWASIHERIFNTACDTGLLVEIVSELMCPDTGVEWIEVKSYSLEIHHSKAVKTQKIYDIVLNCCRSSGFDVTVVESPKTEPRKWWQKLGDFISCFSLIKVTHNYYSDETAGIADPYMR